MKNCNHSFSCKDSLFSLGNYVWDEKWPSFIIPSLIWKLSIVTPFEPDKFLSISRPKITLHTGGQRQREIFSQDHEWSNAWCWKANVREIESRKILNSSLWKKYKWAKAKQNAERGTKEKWNEKKPKEKWVKMKMKRSNEGRPK